MSFKIIPEDAGEHARCGRAATSPSGSSPQMQGARGGMQRTLRPVRIIPADAGSTAPSAQPVPGGGDHPRGCGEHWGPWLYRRLIPGSSPRMRGAPRRGWPGRVSLRIIPADAGSTAVCEAASCFVTDHPRGCGEHIRDDAADRLQDGSFPRMRGAPLYQVQSGLS